MPSISPGYKIRIFRIRERRLHDPASGHAVKNIDVLGQKTDRDLVVLRYAPLRVERGMFLWT